MEYQKINTLFKRDYKIRFKNEDNSNSEQSNNPKYK